MDENEFEGAARDLRGRVKDGIGGFSGDVGLQADGKVDRAIGNAQRAYGETVDNARDAVAEGADRAAEFAHRARASVRDAAGTARRQASEIGGRIYEAGSHAGEVIGEQVQKQPLLSLIGVAAIGYLIGFLIHSTSSPLGPTPAPAPSRRLTWR